MSFIDYDRSKQYNIKVHKKCDYKLTVTKTTSITGYAYRGALCDRETLDGIANFKVDIDEAEKKIYFSLNDAQTADLNTGNNFYYDILQTDDNGETKLFMWGLVSVYDIGVK